MRRISFSGVLFVLIALTGSAFAQAETPPRAKAEQYFFFVLLSRPANAPQLSEEEGEKLQEEHMANIRKMAAEHKLVIAGPFLDDTVPRGIFVFRASAAQAQDWANSDPAVKAGRLSAEVHGPWVIDPRAIHNPDEPPGFEQYELVLMRRGANWNPKSPGFKDTWKQHAAFLKRMMDEGYLAINGDLPISDRDELWEVEIFRVGAEETAKLMQDDPAVKAGLLKIEMHPWGTGKGVLVPGQPMQ